jgi:hypothetical protein
VRCLSLSVSLFDYEKTWKRFAATLRERFSALMLPAPPQPPPAPSARAVGGRAAAAASSSSSSQAASRPPPPPPPPPLGGGTARPAPPDTAPDPLELAFYPCDVTQPILQPVLMPPPPAAGGGGGTGGYNNHANLNVLTSCGLHPADENVAALAQQGEQQGPAVEPPRETGEPAPKLKFDLLVFAYVVHETDDASRAGRYQVSAKGSRALPSNAR